ncbi:uncharacterized protein PGTG_18416 [Puccinia graminis f. sp. tritici CRL 75-36-700-3]|uniref:Uncharacterized protein n=1 Tax=Puccinia graminis f. sp. tritici (strain CRL 75-36-700-3 / race SCCL) TaxID=418459 RepID=E3L5Z0_PUCGT|nr:uncharacterized protein PGTG_18416 [Puccinia graminis f. sp. tritici CRL 75-36-700-3]EFP91965.2 hypothetical protein PGTG_18416 [Puccinia graminis f. sp. tritici CRL 75-36-700-3]
MRIGQLRPITTTKPPANKAYLKKTTTTSRKRETLRMPSWFSSSLKRSHNSNNEHQQLPPTPTPTQPPPPSLKARKLKEQAWQEAIQHQQTTTPNRQLQQHPTAINSSLAIKYNPHQQPRFSNHTTHTPTHRASSSTSSSTSPSWSQQQYTPQNNNNNNNNHSEEVEVLTQSLALRLQELATANHDGLLDDDEYRTLRKGLFDQINASHQQPVLIERSSNLLPNSSPIAPSSFGDSPIKSQQIPNQCYSPDPKSIHTNDRRSQCDAPTLRSARSSRSTSSFLQMIFRRPSRQGGMNGTETMAGDQSMYDHRLLRTASSRAGSVHSAMQSDSCQSSLFTNPSAFGDAGTGMRMSSNGQLSTTMRLSSTAPGELSSPSTRRTESPFDSSPLPRRAPSRYMSASPSPRTINDHQLTPAQQQQQQQLLLQQGKLGGAQDYRQIEWSSTEIKQEIDELELECAKLLQTFDEMEKTLLAKYRAVPRAGPGGPVTKFEELDQLMLLNNNNQQQGQGQAGMGSPMLSGSSTATPGLPDHMVLSDDALARRQSSLRPTSFLAPLLNPRSFKPKTRSIYRDLRPASNSLHQRQPSLLSSLSTNENSSNTFSTTITTTSSSSTTTHPTDNSRAILLHNEQIDILRSDPNQESELNVELTFIANSRLKVAAKYQDRLVYLRAKLKGALIRELSS